VGYRTAADGAVDGRAGTGTLPACPSPPSHVKYCYGNASPCTPTTLIDDTVLTPVGTTIP